MKKSTPLRNTILSAVFGGLLVVALFGCNQGPAQASGNEEGSKNLSVEAATPAPAEPAASQAMPISDAPVAPGASQATTGGAPAASAEAAIATPAADEQSLVLRYAVSLEGAGGDVLRSPENLTFATGNRFRLHLAPSQDVCLYLIHEGTDGKYSLLNPIPGQAASVNLMSAGRTLTMPLGGWYRFDTTAGTERIHVIVSPQKIERMEQLLEGGAAIAQDSAAVKAALDGVRQRVMPGYSLAKQVTADYGEFMVSGGPTANAVLVGTVELKHQ